MTRDDKALAYSIQLNCISINELQCTTSCCRTASRAASDPSPPVVTACPADLETKAQDDCSPESVSHQALTPANYCSPSESDVVNCSNGPEMCNNAKENHQQLLEESGSDKVNKSSMKWKSDESSSHGNVMVVQERPTIAVTPTTDTPKKRRPPLQRGISRNMSDPKILPVYFM